MKGNVDASVPLCDFSTSLFAEARTFGTTPFLDDEAIPFLNYNIFSTEQVSLSPIDTDYYQSTCCGTELEPRRIDLRTDT